MDDNAADVLRWFAVALMVCAMAACTAFGGGIA